MTSVGEPRTGDVGYDAGRGRDAGYGTREAGSGTRDAGRGTADNCSINECGTHLTLHILLYEECRPDPGRGRAEPATRTTTRGGTTTHAPLKLYNNTKGNRLHSIYS